jgi:histone deacetylase 8
MIVHALVSAMGLMSPEFSNTRRIQVVNPGRATYKDLTIYHSRDYLDFVLDPKNSMRELSTNSDRTNKFGLEDVRRISFKLLLPHLTNGRIVLHFPVFTITCH